MAEVAGSGRLARVATGAAVGWLASLPVLGAGMVCFWLQRDAEGALGAILSVGAIGLVALAFIGPGLTCTFTHTDRSASRLLGAAGKALLVAAASLVVASLLSAIEALRPEDVSFFADAFASAHAFAAGAPTLLAVGWSAYAAWRSGSTQRFAWMGAAVVAGAAGVALWWWSAGTGYDAMRFSNVNAILLVAQTVTLSGLLVASVADSALCSRSTKKR